MKKLVTIYQVKQGMTREFGNMSIEDLRKFTKQGEVISMKPYEVVFGEMDVNGAVLFYTQEKGDMSFLNLLFRITNDPSRQPERETMVEHFGFKGRSISMGNIVRINDTFYYCDSYEWEEIKVKNVPHWIYEGMGASGSYYSDINPYEVIKVTPSGKTVTIRRMDWKIIEGTDFDGTAKYEYTSNPEGGTETVRCDKWGQWKTPSGMHVSFGSARRYFDPHF